MFEQDASARIVQAAIELLIEDAGLLLNGGLRGEDAVARARVSQTTFYRKFNKASFIDAVMDQLIGSDHELPDSLRDQIEAVLIANGGDPRKAIRQVATWDFRWVCEDPTTTRQLLALALGKSRPKTMRNLRKLYQAYDQTSTEAYEALLETWGATLRNPFTTKHLGVALTAIVEGLAIRWQADPEAVPDWLFGEIALAFVTSVVDTRQRHEHIDDAAAPLAADVIASFQLSRSDELPDDPRAAVIEAAREEFRRRGYFLTTLELIATSSKVPLPTVKRLFPTKPHIIVGALRRSFVRLAESIHDDVTLGRNEVEVIERHLLRSAKLVSEKPEFMDALIAAVAHDTTGEPESTIQIKQELNFPALIAPVIDRGQKAGTFAQSQPAIEIAATLTNTLFLRCFTRREAEPQEHARFVGGLLLDGLRGRA